MLPHKCKQVQCQVWGGVNGRMVPILAKATTKAYHCDFSIEVKEEVVALEEKVRETLGQTSNFSVVVKALMHTLMKDLHHGFFILVIPKYIHEW